VDDLRKRMEYLWEAERILIDLETLNTYQQLMKGSRLQRYGAADGFFVFRNGPAISLLLRYSHGQIGLEQLLRECQQRYRLMQMEAGE
jgi:hypothetical protein